jgi:hypothetical protein
MSYGPPLGSTITNTKMRTPAHLAPYSGMCTVCTANCTGPCEIGLSALRGAEAINPYQSDINQFASEKEYPLDFSHFNINGRVFGAAGCPEDADLATFPRADLGVSFGLNDPIELDAPYILPAMAKLNWRDYYAGAALSGVPVVIGEEVVSKDKAAVFEGGKVISSPLIEEMVRTIKRYERGKGDIILQANYDDDRLGVLEYAINKLGIRSVELKFGQAAKGIQGMSRVYDIEDALMFQEKGYLIYPDPSDPVIAENYRNGIGPVFEKIGRLPMWDEAMLVKRVADLRAAGARHVCFKTGPYDPRDLAKIMMIASRAGVDLVTFDGAGGGTGHSPAKMMNEWGIPTVEMESIVYGIAEAMEAKGYTLPQIAIAGGFAMEDQVYKGLALGAPYVRFIGIGRAAMAAAMVGRQVGDLIREGKVPRDFQRFGSTVEEIFSDIRELRGLYGPRAAEFPTGAIGLYSYLNRVSVGLRHFMALNRKFALSHIDRNDIVPLTGLAAKVSGLSTYSDILNRSLNML